MEGNISKQLGQHKIEIFEGVGNGDIFQKVDDSSFFCVIGILDIGYCALTPINPTPRGWVEVTDGIQIAVSEDTLKTQYRKGDFVIPQNSN